MCKEINCNEKSVFNYKTESKGEYCKLHKKDKMIEIFRKSNICLEKDCITRASYNYKEKNKGLYCFKHKEEGMVDVISKRCIFEGCETLASYNYEGKKGRLYCKKHKDEGMTLNNKTCIKEGCKSQPNYNFKGKIEGLYCAKHKEEGMIDIKHKKCSENGCEIIPKYNYEGELKGEYCVTHKKTGMVDVIHPKCKNEWCYTLVTEKYEGYCRFCYIYTFPDKPVARNYKTKERAVADFVLEKFPDFTWRIDKIIQDGCSKRRPDLFLDLGYQVIIVEIDENQHDGYDCSCENKRIMQISLDVDHRPIIFIRFNPDDYLKGEENVISCWGFNTTGICVIKKKREWKQRLNILKQEIEYWYEEENQTDKTIEIIQLFYDE